MLWLNHRAPENEKFDIVMVDQLSVSIPLLRCTGAKIFFYCHFPDKLLTKRESLLKKIYRLPVDLIEEITTGIADTIVVNSNFTAKIFKESFKLLKQIPEVLYPSIQFEKFDRTVDHTLPEIQALTAMDKITFLSINRYERKKDIGLAIHAFARLLKDGYIDSCEQQSLRLVIAGGYDTRVIENVEHFQELVQLAERNHSLKTWTLAPGQTDKAVPEDTQVLFLQSISDVQKLSLLQTAHALLYTPSNEHFGIVPVEAMYMKYPVVAVNSGGPTESTSHGETGFLCTADDKVWAETLQILLEMSELKRQEMGQAGHDRVVSLFSLTAFVSKLNGILLQLHQGPSSIESREMVTSVKLVFVSSIVIVLLSIIFYYNP
ncbi:Alpha-1,3-mannosyltransferase-like protein [Modicella reniformis]|uniref:Alpha-1,3/1,6-mannosyltransferase ALG2 n=1 Tax=Modicella reniformis TaxID=1440133 RepID=A0A9P6IJ54_9FUNG|nr:Alpha-1,3-mannosyltransferase-like protein [Modicella reniformis]